MSFIIDEPFLFLTLALLTFWLLRWSFPRPSARRARHRRYVATGRQVCATVSSFRGTHRTGQVICYLRKINPYFFEEAVLEAFHRKGYRIERNTSYSGDGGIDGRIYDEQGCVIFIQAQRYRGHVKSAHLRDFEQLARSYAVRGYFIHTGKTTRQWRGQGGYITVISGSALSNLFLKPKNQASSGTR